MQQTVRQIRVERPARLDDYALLADQLEKAGYLVIRGEPLHVEHPNAVLVAKDAQMDGFRVSARTFLETGTTEVRIWRVSWEPRPIPVKR